MAVPCRVEEWLQQVPHLLLEEDWETVIHHSGGLLQRSLCPWGGLLLKLQVEVTVDEPLENPAHLLVRPEVRALHGRRHVSQAIQVDDLQLVQHTAPGEALLQQMHSWGLSSLCSSFLEVAHRPKDLGDASFTKLSWQRLSRDFPQEGDSALSMVANSQPHASLLLCRPNDEGAKSQCYDMYAVFNVSEEHLALLDSLHLRLLLDSASRMAQWCVNRPGITRLRAADREFYTLLTIQSCRRGLPLLPFHERHLGATGDVVTINDGKELKLDRWLRFDPERYGHEKFTLASYVRLFLQIQKIHDNFETFDGVDGCQLVSFQCMVRKHEWEQVKERFFTAFLMQKKAYRHLNGGSTAPCIRQGGKMRAVRSELQNELAEQMGNRQEREASQHKVVVRRTFLDVPDCDSPVERSKRRHRTTSILQVKEL